MGIRELNAPFYPFLHVYTSTLKMEFLKIFTLEEVFKKKTQFARGQKAKTYRKNTRMRACGLGQSV